MAREPEEEEAAGAAALARGGRGSLGRIGARRPPLWLLCLVVGWLLGAGADAEFSILDEAQVLASQMRRLAAEELGVVTMQVRVPPPLTPCARELARHIPPRSFAQSPVPSPVQVTLTEHRPRPHAQSTLCPGHLWPLRGSPNNTPTPLPSSWVSLSFSCAEAPALCAGPISHAPTRAQLHYLGQDS